ncbi:MAG: helix-turn-helix domain-containing protein [bacterium]|nr:helix-turn-helix domain-containing protein [bacterium]
MNEDNYLIDSWGRENGFPSNYVHAIVQSSDGYLWLGTGSGLVRYDGRKFKTIPIDNSGRWNMNMVMGLTVDPEGTVWLGTSLGLLKYGKNSGKVVPAAPGLPAMRLGIVHYRNPGNLWLGTGNKGLYLFKDGKLEAVGLKSGCTATWVTDICEGTDGILWIGGYKDGLFYRSQGVFHKYLLDVFNEEYSVYGILTCVDGVLWVGTNRGLVVVENPLGPGKKKMKRYTVADGLADNTVWEIFQDSEGVLWVGSELALHRLRRDKFAGNLFDVVLENASIITMFEDREKSLWVGTYKEGLKRLRGRVIKSLDVNGASPSVHIYKDKPGRIWVGDSMGALYRFRDQSFHLTQTNGDVPETGIRCLSEDKEGNMWLGTLKRGLCRFNATDNTLTRPFYSSDVEKPRAIFNDSRGRLWIGGIGDGLGYRQGRHFQFFNNKKKSLQNITNIFEDGKQNIWFSTDNGLYCLEKGEENPERLKAFLPGYHIMGILEDIQEDTLWLGTMYSGIIHFKDSKATLIGAAEGLADNSAFQLVDDALGNFWICGNAGIQRAAKRELYNFVRRPGEHPNISCTLFGLSDGMPIEQCTPSASNSVVKTSAGQLWFATRKGIAVVTPGNAVTNRIQQRAVMEKIAFNGQSISTNAHGKTFKGIHNLEFHFTAVTFINPENVNFRYRLEGYDRQWRNIPPYEERSVFYRDVPPGTYTFKVIAVNRAGIAGSADGGFTFTLDAYFYETLLFKVLVLITLCVLVFFSYYGVRKYLAIRKLNNKYKNSTLNPEKAERVLKKLKYVLEVKKVYKDDELSLSSLAAQIGITPRFLSQVLNEQMGEAFYDLINGYRIEAARRILEGTDTSELPGSGGTILDIGLEVGFNSKPTFNRVFKKYTGMSPSQYKRTTGSQSPDETAK